MSIVNVISFMGFVLSRKKLNNLSAKIKALKKPNETDQRDIKIQQRTIKRINFSIVLLEEKNNLRFLDNQP